MKIYMHLPDQEGQGYHRAYLPAIHAKQAGIDIEIGQHLPHLFYDAFIFHRLLTPYRSLLERIKSEGKKFIWSLDDNLWRIPRWNQASEYYDEAALDMLDWTRDQADHIIVSTARLAQVVNRPDKTTVLPNLIDLSQWQPCGHNSGDQRYDQKNKIHVVWAGSVHHVKDIERVAPAIERLAQEYHDKVFFLFFGDLPESMAETVRVKHSHLLLNVPAERFKGSVGLVRPVPTPEFPTTLRILQPDIALAPLCNHKFNYSKSNLKWLEYSMCGAATIASNVPPYQGIEYGVDGLLVEDDEWYGAIKYLIDNETVRKEMGTRAKNKVKQDWSWQGPQAQQWVDLMQRLANSHV